MNDIEWCFVKSAFILVVGLMKIAERQPEAFFLNCQSISNHQLFTNYMNNEHVPLDFAAQNNFFGGGLDNLCTLFYVAGVTPPPRLLPVWSSVNILKEEHIGSLSLNVILFKNHVNGVS